MCLCAVRKIPQTTTRRGFTSVNDSNYFSAIRRYRNAHRGHNSHAICPVVKKSTANDGPLILRTFLDQERLFAVSFRGTLESRARRRGVCGFLFYWTLLFRRRKDRSFRPHIYPRHRCRQPWMAAPVETCGKCHV